MKKKDIRPSLLDRLLYSERLDDRSRYYSINELRDSVQHDLQALLNTRVRFLSPDPHQEHAQESLFNFGLPDMTTQSLVSEQGRQEFATWIERTIRRFEPRFKHVKVSVGDNNGQRAGQKHDGFVFRVDAMLYADPAPEEISFDSTIDPINQTITLREAHR